MQTFGLRWAAPTIPAGLVGQLPVTEQCGRTQVLRRDVRPVVVAFGRGAAEPDVHLFVPVSCQLLGLVSDDALHLILARELALELDVQIDRQLFELANSGLAESAIAEGHLLVGV